MGVFACLSQVVLLRESLSVAGGNEMSTATAFTGWFLGVALGAFISRRSVRFIGGSVVLSWAAGVLVFLGFALLRLHRVWLQVGIGAVPSLPGTAAALVLGLGLGGMATGSLFTLTAVRLPTRVDSPVSRLFAAESLGAVVGAGLFYFSLADAAPHALSVGIALAVLFSGAAAVSKGLPKIVAVLSCSGIAAAAAFGGGSLLDARLEDIAFRTRQDTTLVAAAQSAYGRLSLSAEDGLYALWVDGRFVYAFPDPYDRPVPVHLALAEHPEPNDILLLGGGPSDRLEAALAHHPKRVVLTYLNDQAARLCEPFWPKSTAAALRDGRVQQIHDDGRRYVAAAKRPFDVIIVAAPPPKSAGENRFHTVSFYRDIKGLLKPGGTAAFIAPGGAPVLSYEAAFSTASTLATIRSQFSEVLIVPGLETLILASTNKGVLSSDPALLAERFKARGIVATSFSERRFRDLLDPGRRNAQLAQLARVSAKINTDELPVVYTANLSMWERSLGDGEHNTASEPVTAFLFRNAAFFFLVPVILFALWLLLQRSGGPSLKARAALNIGVTGAAGMASQIVVMLVFQASFGTLYTAIALLTGAFMCGLAIGGVAARSMFAGGRVRDALIVDLSVVLFLVITGPILTKCTAHAWVFHGWSLVGGVITGVVFPISLGLAARGEGNDERKVAPLIESADHLGAAFGAFVTGLVWIPSYGVTITCLLFAGLKIAADGVWLRRSAEVR